ncbi:MAG: hypothetical protein ACYCUW_02950 [bacterium]
MNLLLDEILAASNRVAKDLSLIIDSSDKISNLFKKESVSRVSRDSLLYDTILISRNITSKATIAALRNNDIKEGIKEIKENLRKFVIAGR